MRKRWTLLGLTLGLALSLSGCATQPWMLEGWPTVQPSPTRTSAVASASPAVTTPVPVSPSADPERARYPYSGTLADPTCVNATRDQLDELEQLGPSPGAVKFPRGALVKSDPPWWTIAVDTQVNTDRPDAPDEVDPVLWFVTNSPSLPAGAAVSTWSLNPDPEDAAADGALACLGVAPAPPPDPPEDSPASYTGRLAIGASCLAAPEDLLRRLEGVGRVGGAITYPRGQMVAANKKWWTVAVATEVHPNRLGHTRENVPAVVYFATNVPSKGAGAASFALESVVGDTAAAAAAGCLAG